MEINQIILTSTIGLLTGAIGSLIAPWINWGIEKKKMRREARIKIIKEIKDIVANERLNRIAIINSPNYMVIRNKLSPKTIEELEKPLNHITVNLGSPAIDFEKRMVFEDICELEKKWRLV